MIQNLNFPPGRSTVPVNSKFLPMSQMDTGISFRDVLASNKQNTIATAITSGNQRDKIIDAINQARVFTPPAFTGMPKVLAKGPANVRDYYSMPPEEVQPMLDKLTEELNNTDFSGKTAIEILDFIENKYIETFGEDFMKGLYLLGNLSATTEGSVNPNVNKEAEKFSNFAYIRIGQSFDWAASNFTYGRGVIDNNTSLWDINRERLYGNKSNSEILDSLKAKYPHPMTNRDLSLMAGELHSVGLRDLGMGWYVKAHAEKPGEIGIHGTMPPWEELEKRWNRVLDRPADLSLLGAIHNVFLRDKESNKNPIVHQTKDLLVNLGVETGPNGYFLRDLTKEELLHLFGFAIDDESGPREFSINKDLIDGFLKDLDQHDKTLRESRERLEKNRSAREVSGQYESTSDNYHNSIQDNNTGMVQ